VVLRMLAGSGTNENSILHYHYYVKLILEMSLQLSTPIRYTTNILTSFTEPCVRPLVCIAFSKSSFPHFASTPLETGPL